MKDKSKVINLFEYKEIDQAEIINSLEELLKEVKEGNVTRLMVAAELKDGMLATGYANMNLVQKQLFLSHIQIDIMWQVVAANLLED